METVEKNPVISIAKKAEGYNMNMKRDSRTEAAGEAARRQRNFYAVEEFCAILDGLVSVPLVYKRISNGDIPVVTVGRRLLIPAWYVNGLLGEHNSKQQA